MAENPKPRSSKPKAGADTPQSPAVLTLNTPTRADGSVHANLATVIEKRFEKIELYADKDMKKILATVHAPEGVEVSNIASALRNYIMAMVDGAFSGTGQGPDGSARFVRDNFAEVNKSTKADLKTVWLVATPKDGARASVKKYIANVGAIVESLSHRADWVQMSEEKFGLTRVKTRNRTKATETPTVFI